MWVVWWSVGEQLEINQAGEDKIHIINGGKNAQKEDRSLE